MGRLFCYTLSARAIGATVSAGALHAQGWGFESLIAHHLIEKAPSDGGLSFLGPVQRDSNPPECGAEETRSVFQRSTRGAERRSGARAAPAARGHPSSPTTELETVLERGPFLFGPISWDPNPTGCGAEETRKRLPAQHARAAGPKRKRAAKWTLGEYPCAKNAKYEYCYLFDGSVFEVIKGKSDIRTTINSPVKPIY